MVESPRAPAPTSLLRMAAIAYGVLTVISLAWNGWAGRPWAYLDASAAARGVDWIRDPSLGLAAAALVIAVSHVLTARTRWGAALAEELARVLGPLTGFECAALAALSGFAEEAFFRGALQPRLGWIGASVLFALAHFAPRRTLWAWTVFALAAGLLLGGLFAATGNLVAPITAHAVINAVNLRLLTRTHAALDGGLRPSG